LTERKRVVVTGASGFVGRHLVSCLAGNEFDVVAACRVPETIAPAANVAAVRMPDLSDLAASWDDIIRAGDCVVHAAALAHGDVNDDRHDLINHLATARLAEVARVRGVERLVFVSSVAAQTGSAAGHVLSELDPPRPTSAYGRSKLAAERAIANSGVRYTILRPVAIYGENAKGNFAALEALARTPIPLPLSGLTGRRSVLSITNFALSVLLVLRNAEASGQSFLVADPVPLSVAEMVAGSRRRAGKSPGLFYVPQPLLRFVLTALGQKSVWTKIGEPLAVSTDRLQSIGWKPET
jgi:nucleoside-diphosphate-sugar epimerase